MAQYDDAKKLFDVACAAELASRKALEAAKTASERQLQQANLDRDRAEQERLGNYLKGLRK